MNHADISTQPTGGVILLHDTQSKEPKSLLELKAKKKTAQPVTGPGNAVGSKARAPPGDHQMTDLFPGLSGGAAAAAGVLTAVDEDEDGEEAPVPDEFEVDEEPEEE